MVDTGIWLRGAIKYVFQHIEQLLLRWRGTSIAKQDGATAGFPPPTFVWAYQYVGRFGCIDLRMGRFWLIGSRVGGLAVECLNLDEGMDFGWMEFGLAGLCRFVVGCTGDSPG